MRCSSITHRVEAEVDCRSISDEVLAARFKFRYVLLGDRHSKPDARAT